jgi:16S rRNA G966 N2-methylase RsmD
MLPEDELQQLADNIAANGLLYPIILFDGLVLDGRNRLAACTLAGVVPTFDHWTGDDPLGYVIRCNIRRRDLDSTQRAFCALYYLPLYEVQARERMEWAKAGGNPPPPALMPEGSDARDHAAHEFNCAARYVSDAKRIDAERPDLAEMCKAGHMTIPQAMREIRLVEAKAHAAEQARAEPTQPQLHCISAEEAMRNTPQASVDLLLTDPPYATDVNDIAEFVESWIPDAMPCLKPSSRMLVCTGPYADELEAYLRAFRRYAKPLGFTVGNVLVWTYRNTLGPQPTHDYKNNWQAIFHVRGPDAPRLDCSLLVEGTAVHEISQQRDKTHPWRKPDELADRLVRHCSKQGDTVFDPFAGTGTFLLAAAKLGRNAHGSEIDPQNHSIAISRGCVDAS